MRGTYDLGALARRAGQRRPQITLTPIASRRSDREALRRIIVSVVDGGADERAALLHAAKAAQSRLTHDDMGLKEGMRLFRGSQDTRLKRANGAIRGWVQRVASWFDARWAQTVKTTLGVDIGAMLASTDLAATVDLVVQKLTVQIAKIADTVASSIEAGLISLITKGASSRAKADVLIEAVTKARKDAERTAKQETETFQAVLNEFRQTQAGIKEYEWWTREDERVRGDPKGLYPRARPSHFARHGKRFSWSKPPERGHPGEDYGCRCVARPVVATVPQPSKPDPNRARLAGLRAVAGEFGLSL